MKALIGTDPQAPWTFICDGLNTHKSESLVRYVAEACALGVELGKKGKTGILKSMESRSGFLHDPSHRIRFVYTPKHGSWMNQIEIRICILFLALVLCMILVVINRGCIKESVDMRVYEYVSSGQAGDFKEQIASQMDILLDDSIKDAYLVPINPEQGPLMHVPVTTDENAFTNRVVKKFYGKDKVVMIEE